MKPRFFSLEYLKLLEWVANHYVCDFVTVLNMAIPLKLIDKNSKTEKTIEFIKDLEPVLTKKGTNKNQRQSGHACTSQRKRQNVHYRI